MTQTPFEILESRMDRRSFLRSSALAVGVAALGPSFWQKAYAATAQPGPGPYGPLQPADANGVMLPKGFTSRIHAVTGDLVPGTTYPWHAAPDGGAVFPQEDGGWVYTSNSEIPFAGGAGALRFGPDGEVVDGYRILTGTSQNCAGGPTPWGTWLSCEENPFGQVYECEVGTATQGVVKPALGMFSHEAVTVDPGRKQLYLTEDASDGRFYRFTPAAYPDLTDGVLEVLFVDAAGAVTWKPVQNPGQPQSRNRLPGSAVFPGGEGIWFDSDHVYFTNKGDNRVWDLDVAKQRLALLYDAKTIGADAPLTGVDNLVVSQSGDIFVAEDGGDLQIVLITPDRVVAPVLELVGHDISEICGPAFSPDGSRLYFSSQRGTDGRGVTFEVTGPFRTRRTRPPARGGLPVPKGRGTGTEDGDAGTGGDVGPADGRTPRTEQAAPAPRLPETGGSSAAAGAAAAATAAAGVTWAARRPAGPEDQTA
jgi:secreted PhoX family phosphatase